MPSDSLDCRTPSQCFTCHHFDEARNTCTLREMLEETLAAEVAAPIMTTRPSQQATFGVEETWRGTYRPTAADTVPLFAWADAADA